MQFEYQQAQLEKEVEELSWAVERADSDAKRRLTVREGISTTKCEIESLKDHMHRAEHKRRTLLHRFFFSDETDSSNVAGPSSAK